jgi:hypothetical protein
LATLGSAGVPENHKLQLDKARGAWKFHHC